MRPDPVVVRPWYQRRGVQATIAAGVVGAIVGSVMLSRALVDNDVGLDRNLTFLPPRMAGPAMRACAARSGSPCAAGLGGGVGCGDDTIRIGFAISGGPAQACLSADSQVASSCADVPMLRRRAQHPHRAAPGPGGDVPAAVRADPAQLVRGPCAVEQINLPVRELPKETLEVR